MDRMDSSTMFGKHIGHDPLWVGQDLKQTIKMLLVMRNLLPVATQAAPSLKG